MRRQPHSIRCVVANRPMALSSTPTNPARTSGSWRSIKTNGMFAFCTRRITSTTPTQALALLNGSFVAAQAAHFAERLKQELPSAADREKLDRAYEIAFSRPPAAGERASALQFLAQQQARYQAAGKPEAAAREQAWTDLCHSLLCANEFAYVD